MLEWVIIFLVLAIISGLFGFSGIAAASVGIAQTIFFIFIVFLVIALLFGAIDRNNRL